MAKRKPSVDGDAAQRTFEPPTTAELAEIVQLSDDAIIVTDEALRIVFFNDGAQETFGYDLSLIHIFVFAERASVLPA